MTALLIVDSKALGDTFTTSEYVSYVKGYYFAKDDSSFLEKFETEQYKEALRRYVAVEIKPDVWETLRSRNMAKKIKTEAIGETKDIIFSFDTTGSMYPCLTQVRNVINETAGVLFRTIPDLRIGVIAHGDYCDKENCLDYLDLTNDLSSIVAFVRSAPATNGGDADECYELALNKARAFNWTSGKSKALVLIGDCNPHKVGYAWGPSKNSLDWRNEARLLVEAGISIYPIQALGRSGSDGFYQGLANLSGTPKLELPQFSDIVDILSGVVYQQADLLDSYIESLQTRTIKPSLHTLRTLAQLGGKTVDLSTRSVKIVGSISGPRKRRSKSTSTSLPRTLRPERLLRAREPGRRSVSLRNAAI